MPPLFVPGRHIYVLYCRRQTHHVCRSVGKEPEPSIEWLQHLRCRLFSYKEPVLFPLFLSQRHTCHDSTVAPCSIYLTVHNTQREHHECFSSQNQNQWNSRDDCQYVICNPSRHTRIWSQEINETIDLCGRGVAHAYYVLTQSTTTIHVVCTVRWYTFTVSLHTGTMKIKFITCMEKHNKIITLHHTFFGNDNNHFFGLQSRVSQHLFSFRLSIIQ
jgi:hypothetical protein